jgi:ABC-type nitrate/sulfonate/bicarbonate transport system ATPase subunit
MVLRPRLMLLDEPFGALDQQTRLLMGEETLKLWRETNSTIMLITHSIDEAVLLSDRIGIMSARPGKFIDIVETGWSRERGSETALDPRYGELQSEIWRKLRQESMKALGAGQ